ncbi:hypothetical protein HXX76_009255 [Chlamydomonas incerta]|uniref:Uncharacterized protein n=1 Tax=Chlamydomonas incerta TaxID=51695 RepID=A0A835VZU3_CHLIN|nr:hypothetical protein HXX76_009255 [Chlamydomonas incerta]|eukprot:KAG2431759.1 hypothetical protein HXX76_009255 [Chlamydomonas incerta]
MLSSNPVIAAAPWPGWQFAAHWAAPEPWRALNLHQRRRLLCLAASSGHGPSLDAALAHCGCSLTSEVLVSAARAGRTAACKRLLAEGCEVGVEAACAAAEAGHLRLCSLLWSKRRRDYTCGSDVVDADVVRVAEAACFGGHATVLQWLAQDAGLYDEAVQDECRRQWINEELATAAARGGHVSLMRRLFATLPAPQEPHDSMWPWLLGNVALGCPLPVFRDLAAKWRLLEPPQPDDPWAVGALEGSDFVHCALGSGTPDWKEKVELVLARRPDILAAAMADMDKPPPCMACDPLKWAAAQPDFEQRLRYLVSDKGVAPPRSAAVAAAGAGDVGALRFLLDECGVRLSDDCIREAARHDQRAVLEFLRDRGQLPSRSGDGRTLDTSAAPVCVLAATAMTTTSSLTNQHVNEEPGFWGHVFDRVARQGTDVAALRYLHERLGTEVQLRPIAAAGSVEQLEWALGGAAGGADAAAAEEAQGPAPTAQDLLLAALQAGNLAAASHLHARGVAPVLPTAAQVSGHYYAGPWLTLGYFDAVRWLVEQRRALQAAAAGGAGAGGAAAVAEAAAVGEAAGEAAAGLADAEWDKLLAAVGEDGRLRGRFSENQWEWLTAAFLASPVLPHATAACTKTGVVGAMSKREQASAASAGAAGSGHKAEACSEHAREREREHEREREREREHERLEAVMAARRRLVAGVEQGFRAAVARVAAERADTERRRLAVAAANWMYDSYGSNSDADEDEDADNNVDNEDDDDE